MTKRYNLTNIRTLLTGGFNDQELRNFCFDTSEFRPVHDQLAISTGKAEIVTRLLEYAHQKLLLEVLLTWAKKHNSAKYKECRPYYYKESISPATSSGITRPPSPAPPFQAPLEPSYFVGRKEEVEQLGQQITTAIDNQIIGLTGLGGVGKTALATHLAHAWRGQFKDGVLWAQLDATSPAVILRNFAAAFDQAQVVAEISDLSEKAAIVRQILANKNILIVLDNAEESETTRWLIPNGKGNVTLITTRNQKLLVNVGAKSFDIRPFNAAEGVELLKQLFKESRISTKEEEEIARKIVKLVGGLPLALNIVGGYLSEAPDLTVAEYAAELEKEEQRLDELKDWEDEATKNVEAAFQLSYRRLEQFGQTLFSSLAVFNGPDFSSEAVAAVLRISPVKAKRELGHLRMLSLVEAGFGERGYSLPTQPADLTRYRLHTLLRLFAKRQASSELNLFQQRAVAHFAQFAEDNGTPERYEALDLDWENIVGALGWAYEQQDWEMLLTGVHGLTAIDLDVIGFMDARGYWSEARQILEWGLKGVAHSDALFSKAVILAKLGAFEYRQASADIAKPHLQESLAILERLSSTEEGRQPKVFLQKAFLYGLMAGLETQEKRQTGEAAENAIAWLEQGRDDLARFKTSDAQYQTGNLYILQSTILGSMGALKDAVESCQKGIDLLPTRPTAAKASGFVNLSNFHYWQGNAVTSLENLHKAITMAQALNDLPLLAVLQDRLGTQELEYGELDKAVQYYQEAAEHFHRQGNIFREATTYSNLGFAYNRLGEIEPAFDHLSHAIELAETFHLLEAEAVAKINWTRLHLDAGRPGEVEQAIIRAEEICRQNRLIYELPEALSLRAEIALTQEDFRSALAFAAESLQAAKACQFALAQGRSRRVQADILSVLMEIDQAEKNYQASEDILAGQDQYELAQTKLAFARHHYRNKKFTAIREKAQEALAIFDKLAAKREIASVRALLAQLS